MDAIETRCPHCHALFRLPPNQFGTVVRCGRCRQTFTPTAAEAMPEEPPPLPDPPRPTAARVVARPVEPTPARARPVAAPRPRRKSGGMNLGLILALLGGVAVLLLAAVGGIAYLVYTQVGKDADRVAATPAPIAEPPPPVPAAPPKDPSARDDQGNVIEDDPLNRPIREATVGVSHRDRPGMGSGFVVDSMGHVVTTARVVGHGIRGGARPQSVELTVGGGRDQRKMNAQVVAVDATLDLALLRADDPSRLPWPAEIAMYHGLNVNDRVWVYGYRYEPRPGEGAWATRVKITKIGTPDWQTGNELQYAAIDRGFSGGPVAGGGQVLGVVSVGPDQGEEHFVHFNIVRGFVLKHRPPTPPVSRPPVRPTPSSPKPPTPTPPAPTPPPAPTASADRSEIRLPEAVADTCVGGAGRYFILHLPQSRQLAIFDVNQMKVARYLSLPARNVRFAANRFKLFVVDVDAGTISRYDLAKFVQEATAPLPFQGKVIQVAMGHGGPGPLLVRHGKGDRANDAAPVVILDSITLQEIPTGKTEHPALATSARSVMHYRVSPSGMIFGAWCTSHSPGGLSSVTLTDGKFSTHYEHTSVGQVLPTDSGVLVTGGGLFTIDAKPIRMTKWDYRLRVPAADGPFYLSAPGGGGAQLPAGTHAGKPTTVYAIGDGRPIATLPDVELPVGDEGWTKSDFTQDRRVFFAATAKLIAVVPATNDRIVLHRFDLYEHLEKSGADYLYVTSRPPVAAPGKEFDYQLQVKSKRGEVSYKLDAGPEGMLISPRGRITWDAPAAFETVSVMVTVTDAGGQEAFHTFRLAGPGGKAVAAKPKTPAPGPQPPAPTPPQPGVATTSTPPKPSDGRVVRLPAATDDVCVAGGGRYLIFRLPKTRQLAVFDTGAGKVVKYLPLAEDNALFAAGMTKLFVLNPAANVLQRWSLATFEKETTVPNPAGGSPKQILMGHASDGPLYVGGPAVTQKHYAFLDPRTFREVEVKVEGGRGGPSVGDTYPHTVRVSPDGRVYTWWTPGLSPSGLNSMVVGRTTAKSYNEHTTVGAILPGPDGTLFTAAGLYTPELKRIGSPKGYQYWHLPPIPAADGPWYLQFENTDTPGGRNESKPPRTTLKMIGDERPIVTLPELSGLGTPARGGATGPTLPLIDRVHFIPSAELLVVVSDTLDQLHLHKFKLQDQLDRSGIDYLLVTSRPPTAVGRGTRFSYTPTVLSKKGGVKVKLESGPDGMTVSGAAVRWNVPKDFDDSEANVILLVTDATGQEAFHTFKLAVRDKVVEEKAAPPDEGGGATAVPEKRPESAARPYEEVAKAFAAKPCPLEAAVEERPLPSAAGPTVAVGGAGRYLILHLPKERQLAVFDVTQGKVTKYLPAADDRPLFAAGRSVLVVYMPGANAFVRYRLPKFEKEATVVSTVGGVRAVGMGSAADGPLFVLGEAGNLTLLDPKTFREAGEVKGVGIHANSYYHVPLQITVSETGGLVGGAAGALARSGTAYKKVPIPEGVLPTPDGRTFLTRGRLYTAEGRPIGQPVDGHGHAVWYVPAARGPYYVSLNEKRGTGGQFLELRVHMSGEQRSLFTLPRVEAVQKLIDWHSGSTQPFDRHVFLFPEAKLLAVLPADRTKLVLHRVDADELMVQAGVDYLMVTSQPPPTVAPGETFRYTPAVRSKRGQPRLRLESGPDGMTLSDGALSWRVPSGTTSPVVVVLAVTDASGQEVFHNFTLTVQAKN